MLLVYSVTRILRIVKEKKRSSFASSLASNVRHFFIFLFNADRANSARSVTIIGFLG